MTCAKQTVTATIVNGPLRFVGTNHANNPQSICPRAEMPTGIGYKLCKSICQQENHAEVNAILAAGEHSRGATLYLEGHTYACEPCKLACHFAGIKEIVIGGPPA